MKEQTETMNVKKVLVATFGFDIDFVMKRLAESRYDKVILLALKTDYGFDRVEKSYHLLAVACKAMNIECILEPIDLKNLIKVIYSMLEHVAETSKFIDLLLTGGPRVLVISSLIAALMLPNELIKKINIIVEGETFDCKLLTPVHLLRNLITLDDKDRRIVFALSQGKMRLSEISEKTEIPKTTMHRRIHNLVKDKIVCEEGEYFILCDETLKIL